MTLWSVVVRETVLVSGPAPAGHVGTLAVEADVDLGQADRHNRRHPEGRAVLEELDLS